MPRGDFNIYFASGRRGFVRAEEYVAVGIALLVIILGALLILGCWYFKKRSGYRIIRVRSSHFTVIKHPSQFISDEFCVVLKLHDLLKVYFHPLIVIPNAPPAYEKISSGPLPPPYSP
uniref:Uncharacterized protein n=1 Tax=Amphiprion ocellaris TaxID=80972 RepID=A0A3Q1CW05_AMPOC